MAPLCKGQSRSRLKTKLSWRLCAEWLRTRPVRSAHARGHEAGIMTDIRGPSDFLIFAVRVSVAFMKSRLMIVTASGKAKEK